MEFLVTGATGFIGKRVVKQLLERNISVVASDIKIEDEKSRNDIINEHAANPLYSGTKPGEPAPMYSPALVRLIDKLRLVPQKNKHTIVETKPWEEYTIGILPGHRGGKIILTKETYPTRGKAEHAIFLKRLKDLLSYYGIDS